jgi:hypothetical protein
MSIFEKGSEVMEEHLNHTNRKCQIERTKVSTTTHNINVNEIQLAFQQLNNLINLSLDYNDWCLSFDHHSTT